MALTLKKSESKKETMKQASQSIPKPKIEKISFRDVVDIPSTTHATFGLYRYPAKFIPHAVSYVLDTYTKPEMTIFDPFGGYGTSGTVSKIFGNDYEMWDLNPMLKILHPISIMKPIFFDIQGVIQEMKNTKKHFVPDWDRQEYWFKPDFLSFLYKVWGYYHSIQNKKIQMTLTIPLLKVTRYFSYDDMQRQKLSQSPMSQKRIKSLFMSDWQTKFYQMLEKNIMQVQKGQKAYWELSPKKSKCVIKTGVDAMEQQLKENKDILITSPPYLQSQEYMRQAKLDLYWLGFAEKKIKSLSKLEIPYRSVKPYPILSKTYEQCLSHIDEPHIKKILQTYFWCMAKTFTSLSKKINNRMFIFVGHSSLRGQPIPIDTILIEHLSNFGWFHEKTLSDSIVGRNMFEYSVNPASKRKDARTTVENMVILKRH